jgi:hypothetical protein
MKKELIGALVWAGVMLALAFGATAAHRLGYIDRETVQRISVGVIGLWIAWYGNLIPKRFAPSAQAKLIQRVAAWSQVLSGLTYAGLWAFAPIPLAITAGCFVVLAGVAVTFGFCLTLGARPKAG